MPFLAALLTHLFALLGRRRTPAAPRARMTEEMAAELCQRQVEALIAEFIDLFERWKAGTLPPAEVKARARPRTARPHRQAAPKPRAAGLRPTGQAPHSRPIQPCPPPPMPRTRPPARASPSRKTGWDRMHNCVYIVTIS